MSEINQKHTPEDIGSRAIELLYIISLSAHQNPDGSFMITRSTMMAVDHLVQQSGRGDANEFLTMATARRDWNQAPDEASKPSDPSVFEVEQARQVILADTDVQGLIRSMKEKWKRLIETHGWKDGLAGTYPKILNELKQSRDLTRATNLARSRYPKIHADIFENKVPHMLTSEIAQYARGETK